MDLEKRIGKLWRENKEFILASGLYIAAAAMDYFYTASGLASNNIREANPILSAWISDFGIDYGLLIPKLALATASISAFKRVDGKRIIKGKFKFKSKYFLYGGAALTAGIYPLSWCVSYIAD